MPTQTELLDRIESTARLLRQERLTPTQRLELTKALEILNDIQDEQDGA